MELDDFDNAVPVKKQSFPLNIIQDKRLRVIFGFFFIILSGFLFLSFLSFLFTWQHDQSVLDNSIFNFISNKDITVENWGGKLGALISKKAIHDWLGVSSFLFVFILLISGFRLLNLKLFSIRKLLRLLLVLIILLSVVGGYLFRDMWDANIGGAHGYFISQWMVSAVGEFGTGMILLAAGLAFVLYTVTTSADAILSFFSSKKKEVIDRPFEETVVETPKANPFDDSFFIRKEEPAPVFEPEPMVEEVVSEPVVEEQTEPQISEADKEPQKPQPIADEPKITFEVIENHPIQKNDEELITSKDDVLELLDNENEVIEELEYRDIELKAAPQSISHETVLEETLIGETPVTITTISAEDKAENINYDILGDYDPTLELSHYKLPPIDILVDHKSDNSDVSDNELKENLNKIVETLGTYKISIDKIKATIGPTVTLYEIIPAPGVRISKIKNLEDDIALSLAALGIRIIAPIPGKGTIGIEVPNKNPQLVSMRSILESKAFQDSKFDLPLALGKTISNETFVVDLCKMPHLLVAGATGMGKSVGLSAIMASLLYKKHPSQLKFVLVDPKKVELTLYSKIENHFLAKLPDSEEAIITDTTKVVNTLNSLCIEMDERYNLLKTAKLRTIKEYNAKFIKRQLNPEEGHRFLPYIIVVIDEFADLIMTAGKEVELPIARLAQLARAIGIHLIIATQRPTTNIITGVIKANFPARIAFRVTSGIDSRTILDETGANQLIGKGDMLVNTGSGAVRVQCAFIDTPEIDKVTDFISLQQSYGSALILPEYQGENAENGAIDVDLGRRDSMFDDAARLVVSNQQGSTSLIQRKFSIGYNRAGRIMDQLEAAGIVGPQEGSKPRQVLVVDLIHLERILETM